MTVITRSHGKMRKPFLGCLSHYKRGSTVCPNGKLVPLAHADEAVLKALKADALDQTVVTRIIDMVFERLTPTNVDAELAALETELGGVEAAIAQLKRAIERVPDLEPVIERMQERQQQRVRLAQQIAGARILREIQLDRPSIEADVQIAVAKWRETLATEAVEGGRALLREVLTGPLVFSPNAKGYTFRGPVVVGELIAGAVNEGLQQAGAQQVASPAGFEPAL